METFGQLVDKLTTVNFKMWWAQEDLYKIRRMTLEEFTEFCKSKEGIEKVYNYLKKACDLNIQRNNMIQEVDSKLLEIINAKDQTGYIQNQHKTY